MLAGLHFAGPSFKQCFRGVPFTRVQVSRQKKLMLLHEEKGPLAYTYVGICDLIGLHLPSGEHGGTAGASTLSFYTLVRALLDKTEHLLSRADEKKGPENRKTK